MILWYLHSVNGYFPALLQIIFGNCVDQDFVGIAPIPQKNTEWMGTEVYSKR